jgi:hypothetical protein
VVVPGADDGGDDVLLIGATGADSRAVDGGAWWWVGAD